MAQSGDEIRVLRDISSNTHRFLQHFRRDVSSGPQRQRLSITSGIEFSNPRPIAPYLTYHGVKPTVADSLSRLYLQSAYAIKQGFEHKFALATSAYLDAASPDELKAEITRVKAAFESQYERSLRMLAEKTLVHSQQYTSADLLGAQSDSERKVVFVKSAIALLEDAFERNAYPTRAEKTYLAKVSRVELKQVHIWFQNRRSRSRREGTEMQKYAPSHYCRRFRTSPSIPEVLSSRVDDSSCSHIDSKLKVSTPCVVSGADVFNLQAPPHAFPGPYPPVCDYDPFPLRNKGNGFQCSWPRTPLRTIPRLREVSFAHVDEISEALRGASIAGQDYPSPMWRKSQPLSISRNAQYSAECFPALIYPASAPLPALLCTTVLTHTGVDIPAGPSQQPVMPNFPKGTLRAPVSSLPTRIRRSPRTSVQPYHPASSPHHGLRRLRLSSSSSSLYSDSSSSSMSSSPSSRDTPLLTPPQLTLDLPHPSKFSASAHMLGRHPDLDQFLNSSPASPRYYDGPHLTALAC